MHAWLRAASIYRDPRIAVILFLGFSSGLPRLLTLSTLAWWMSEAGIDLTTIGLFALVGLPYSVKFLWAPLIDRAPLPFLTRLMGRRRGWALFTQLALVAAILGLGATQPDIDPWSTAAWALGVAFLSASQDVVIDAYRVEILDEHQYGAGAAAIVLGYRIGLLVSGAGALFLATHLDWFGVYAAMAALMGVGIVTILVVSEPSAEIAIQRPANAGAVAAIARRVHGAVVAPFTDFIARRGWAAILLFVLLYKFGDALLGGMAFPFYQRIGFTGEEVAAVSKIFGIAVTIAGGFVGGVMIHRIGIMRSLFVGGVLQMLSNLIFVVQAIAGADLAVLVVTVTVENFTGGMATAAFVAYLSSLCRVSYTATQYALLSAVGTLGTTLLSSTGGWLAEQLGWIGFFLLTTAVAVPGLLVLMWLMRREPGVGLPREIN